MILNCSFLTEVRPLKNLFPISLGTLASVLMFASLNSTALAASTSTSTSDSKVHHKVDGKALEEEQRLLDSGQTSECESKLDQILRGDPTNLPARKLHAESLYRLGRYHFAADEIDLVLKQQPPDAGSVLLAGKIYQSLHKPALAVEFYKKFLALNPDDQLGQQYTALVTVLENEASSKAAAGTSARKDVGDYLNAVATPSLTKWKNATSIRVFIRDGKDVVGYRPEFDESLRQAFDDWHEATSGKIGFVFVTDQADAQMTVTWSSDLHAPQFTGEAGLAKYTTGPDGYSAAEILLLTQDPFKDGPVGHNFIYNVSLHEIGHALGLQGHSPHEDDIMFPTLAVQQGLSPRDINTILTLYGDRPATTVILTDKDQWGRPLPPAVVAERLAREASALVAANQLPQAIAKLEESLKLEVKTPTAKENLAVAYNNLAIAKETEDHKKIELLHQSLFWNPKLDGARTNLNNYLQSLGHDPKSFAERVKLADQCAAQHDAKGASVEYTEALSIKEDSAVRNKLSQLQKNLPHF